MCRPEEGTHGSLDYQVLPDEPAARASLEQRKYPIWDIRNPPCQHCTAAKN